MRRLLRNYRLCLALLLCASSPAWADLNAGPGSGGGNTVSAIGTTAIWVDNQVSVKGDGTTDDTPAIQTLINNASSAGGGTIYLGPKTYFIPGGLTAKPNVHILGSACAVTTDNNFSYAAGTRLLGNNTNPGISYIPNTYSSQPTGNQIVAQWLMNFSVEDLCIDTVTYGLQFGSLFNSGLGYDGHWRHFQIFNPSVWGIYCENCSESTFDNLFVYHALSSATGNMYFGTSQTNFNQGNNLYSHLFAYIVTSPLRGIVFQARAGSQFNDINVFDIQTNQSSSGIVSQAATMANASSTIAVTDGTKFPLDMPVTVSANANGFVQYQTYFVVSRSGNNLQLANKQRGTALTASGNTAVNLITYGWPDIEIAGYDQAFDPNAGANPSAIQSATFFGLDMEGPATCAVALQNANINIGINFLGGASGQGTSFASDLCARNVIGSWASAVPVAYDSDHADIAWSAISAPLRTSGKAVIQKPPLGIFQNALGIMAFNIQDGHDGLTQTFQSQLPQNLRSFTYPNVAIGQTSFFYNITGGVTLNAEVLGNILVTAANANDVMTLPTLDNTAPATAQQSWAGAPFEIANGSSVTIKVQVAGTQYFNRQTGLTAFTLPPGASISLRASWDNLASYWAIVSNYGGTPNIAQPGVALGSLAYSHESYQPGLLTSIVNTKSIYATFAKASTVDNIKGSAQSLTTCTTNPTITMYECGTDASCAAPTTIGSVTITATGQRMDGTVSNAAIAAGDSIAWAISAGACASLDIGATAQVHTN